LAAFLLTKSARISAAALEAGHAERVAIVPRCPHPDHSRSGEAIAKLNVAARRHWLESHRGEVLLIRSTKVGLPISERIQRKLCGSQLRLSIATPRMASRSQFMVTLGEYCLGTTTAPSIYSVER
jgi:hypothetical protein